MLAVSTSVVTWRPSELSLFCCSSNKLPLYGHLSGARGPGLRTCFQVTIALATRQLCVAMDQLESRRGSLPIMAETANPTPTPTPNPLPGCVILDPRRCPAESLRDTFPLISRAAGQTVYCGNQAVAGITFLKPTQIREIKTYLSKRSCSGKRVHPHCFQAQ